MNGNLLTFRLPAPCCKLLYNLAPSPNPLTPPTPTLLRTVLQGHLRFYFPTLKF